MQKTKMNKIIFITVMLIMTITIISYDKKPYQNKDHVQITAIPKPIHATPIATPIAAPFASQNTQLKIPIITKPETLEQVKNAEYDVLTYNDYLDTTNEPATQKNINAVQQDAFFSQINQEQLTANGIASGYLIQDSTIRPLPNPANITSDVQDETAFEINQQTIIDNARLSGYVITEPEYDGPLPTDKNLTLPATGEFADQINR